ncbi:hypothetical protein AMK32_29975 [Streptomyces sp. CB01883]|nr:hypothetical protein AMK32_29975 [Streptomyces sp. CB01883]
MRQGVDQPLDPVLLVRCARATGHQQVVQRVHQSQCPVCAGPPPAGSPPARRPRRPGSAVPWPGRPGCRRQSR